MFKNALNFSWILVLCALLVSCNKEDQTTTDEETVAEFANNTVYAMQQSAALGHQGCYELVFPIFIEYEDGTISEYNSYDELREGIMAWKEANPDAEARPQLQFPIEMISEDGELITVDDHQELRRIREACGRPFRPDHHRPGQGGCNPCFQFVFPFNIEFPDGTIEEITSRQDLKQTIRAWKQANPDADERPQLVFPITVEMEDGTLVTVNSQEELIALREDCG